jgi:aspartate oxidase
LSASACALEDDWHLIAGHGHATGRARVELRAAAAIVATARWVIASARERRETRGTHYRDDARDTDPAQARRLLSGGLDHVWVRPLLPVPAEAAA